MKCTAKTFNGKQQPVNHEAIRRQQANFERFMQEKADVFQVTQVKAQAMFWAMS